MYKRRHWDGTPLTSSEKTSVIDSNISAVSEYRRSMKSASGTYSFAGYLYNTLAESSASLSKDPFQVGKDSLMSSYQNKMSLLSSARNDELKSASSLSQAYQSVTSDQDAMINGTAGEQVASAENAKHAMESKRAEKVQIDNDPYYSLSYSASQSASESIASLSPSAKESMLNSIANAKRNGGHIFTNSNNDPSQQLTPSQLQPFTNPNTIPAQRNKRGNK